MRVLVACEYSGVVRDAFAARGHFAVSCDLLPSQTPGMHFQGDVLDYYDMGWDLMIAHPPCTYLTIAAAWCMNNPKFPERARQQDEAEDFFMEMMNAPIDRVCIENPVGVMSSRFRKPDQIIQPYQFGENASKRTCLWLKGFEPLVIDKSVRYDGRWVNGKERWANQTDSGQNKLRPQKRRSDRRSATYPLIAKAMAEAWG